MSLEYFDQAATVMTFCGFEVRLDVFGGLVVVGGHWNGASLEFGLRPVRSSKVRVVLILDLAAPGVI